MAKEAKLEFITECESLKPSIECNSIPQVLLHFNYLERWGASPTVQESLPEDAKNIKECFALIRKMSDTGFQVKKFKEYWTKYNMEDICEYNVIVASDNTSDGE